jgi:hypothetical protein
MSGHPVPGVFCVLRNEPVDLRLDLYADEHGQAVHEECYIKRITGEPDDLPFALFGD